MARLYSDPAINNSPTDSIPERVIFGRSRAMRDVRESVKGVASACVPVLLLGEPGTGKEVIAREIHRLSPWCSAPFMKFSVAEPMTGPLSGGAEGAFVIGSFGHSAGNPRGTLFIEAVGELSPPLQAKLLELFHDGSLSDIHREFDQPQGVRVICASGKDLEEDVRSGIFRLDLFYRINVVTISLPSLRQRREDIPELAEYLFESWRRQRNGSCPRIPSELLHMFCGHDWPGNIRELDGCVRTYVDTNGNAELTEAFLFNKGPGVDRGESIEHREKPIPLKTFKKRLVEQAERDLILRVLRQQQWNRKETAKVLQVSYQTLLHKLQQVGLSRKRQPQPSVVDQQVQE